MIRITNALPNPIGADSPNEWVKIKNEDEEILLREFRITDLSNKGKIIPELKLSFGEEKTFLAKDLGFTLNNDGDRICLEAKNLEKHCVEYLSSAKEGEIISFEKENYELASIGFPVAGNNFPVSPLLVTALIFGLSGVMFFKTLGNEK